MEKTDIHPFGKYTKYFNLKQNPTDSLNLFPADKTDSLSGNFNSIRP